MVSATVDAERRALITPNHSMTHILNLALREVVGKGTDQRGSVNTPEKLRFDFNAKALNIKQLSEVQRICREKVGAEWIALLSTTYHALRTNERKQERKNEGVRASLLSLSVSLSLSLSLSHTHAHTHTTPNVSRSSFKVAAKLPVFTKLLPLPEAQKISSLRCMFGEKYPAEVRVVAIGKPVDEIMEDPSNPELSGLSIELCGGTHVEHTGQVSAPIPSIPSIPSITREPFPSSDSVLCFADALSAGPRIFHN